MPRGTVVKVHKVMPFSPPGMEETYVSRMLIDAGNSGSQRLQVNHGVVRPGQSLEGAVHDEPYDEIYYVLSGQASLRLGDEEVDLEEGSTVFIPGGTFHALTNKSQTEDFVILTIWPGEPEPGVNGVYDLRKEAWGTTYREI